MKMGKLMLLFCICARSNRQLVADQTGDNLLPRKTSVVNYRWYKPAAVNYRGEFTYFIGVF